jgi:hypothetical protein
MDTAALNNSRKLSREFVSRSKKIKNSEIGVLNKADLPNVLYCADAFDAVSIKFQEYRLFSRGECYTEKKKQTLNGCAQQPELD